MFTERIKQSAVRQFTAVTRAESPANYLSGLEAHDYCKVTKSTVMLHEGEVLHPGLGIDHACITHAVLRTVCILEASVAMQDILWCRYLCRNTSGVFMLGGCNWDDYARFGTYSPRLVLAPAEVYCQPTYTIERMLLMHSLQLRYCCIITFLECGWLVVECTLADMK